MRGCLKLIIIVVIIFSFPVVTFGTESEEELRKDLYGLYDEAPHEVRSVLDEKGFTPERADELLSVENILSLVWSYLYKALLSVKSEYGSLIFLSVSVFVFELLLSASNMNMNRAVNTAVLSVFGVSVFEIVNGFLSDFTNNYLLLSGVTSATCTVSATAMLTSASSASAAALGTFCSVLIAVFDFICNTVVIPFINAYLAVDLSGSISGNAYMTRISRFIRNASITVSTVFLTFFTGVMSVQNIVSMSGDTMLKKSVKQILSSGLPILGGAVSDGMDILFTAVNGIKNSAGIFGIFASVILSCTPIAELLVFFILLSVTGALFSLLGGNSVSDFFTTVRDVVSVLICLSVSLSIMTVLLFYFIIRVE